ncbi:MAG TPA: nucleotide-binding domain containing protein, partial [Acetobacteraceae bacterium]|nr:nucleotide-binding domain containing protein [Acetobacteraceae bacterium]
LGAVLARALPRAGVTRVAVAGGDTSGEVTQALGVAALEAIAPVVPGAPLCRAYRREGGAVEVILKGGQMGGDDVFGKVKGQGGSAPLDPPLGAGAPRPA